MLYNFFLEVCCIAVLLCNVQRNIFQNRFGNDVVLNDRPHRQQKLSSRETEIKFSTRPKAQRRSQVRVSYLFLCFAWSLVECVLPNKALLTMRAKLLHLHEITTARPTLLFISKPQDVSQRLSESN